MPVLSAAAATLGDLQARLAANRPLFLSHLKAIGVSKLGERQSLANAISRAEKVGLLAPPVALPHHRPAVFEEDDETLTVRLKIPAAATSNQFKVSIEVNALRVDFCGEPTALVGTLCAVIKPYDSTWEIERSPPPEYDPLCDAADQPPPSDDVIVLTLTKATPGRWSALFSDAVAKRHAPPPAAVDTVSKDKSASPRPLAVNKNDALTGAPLGFKQRKFDPERERRRNERRQERAAERALPARDDPSAQTPAGRARDLWSSAGTRLVWRGGAGTLHGAPDAPDGCAPFYTWEETQTHLVVTAATRKGLRARDVSLRATPSAVDCLVDGAPTPWSGTLVGKVDPARCALEVVAGVGGAASAAVAIAVDEDGADEEAVLGASVCDTLRLTLAKAEPNELWRAPWPELIAPLGLREKRALVRKPTRAELAIERVWDELETEEEWLVKLPYKGGFGEILSHDDLRVALSADTLNIHVAGQEEAPLLGGELCGRLDVSRCSWAIRDGEPIGSIKVEVIDLVLVKETKGAWDGLFRIQYT